MTTRTPAEHGDGYEAFFGLSEAPFSLAPNPRFLFAGASHSAALAQVAYALQRREPLIVVTGEIGTGKTLLCRTVLQRLRRKTFLSVINDPLLERDDLLKQMLQDFGVISQDRTKLTETSRHQLVEALHAFLKSLTPLQAHAVVIVDDAQHLKPEVLEQIRLLSNIDDEGGTLLQIILVGQRDLDPLLARPELRQLQQRVSRRIQLEPLNGSEVAQYIEHRLALAGVGRPPSQIPGASELAQELAAWDGTKPSVEFTADAMRAVSEISGGVPRVINLLCDRSLEESYAARRHTVDNAVLEKAARELGLDYHVRSLAAQSHPTAVPETETSAESIWSMTPREWASPSQTVQPGGGVAEEQVRLDPGPAATPRLPRYLVLAVAVALIGVVAVYVFRHSGSPRVEAPSSAPAVSAPRAPDAQPDRAPEGAAMPAPTTPAPPETSRRDIGTPSSRSAAPATEPRFDIVVASFRTDARATAVAAEIASLGLPIRRRVTDGWQQVICGPFASRMAAEEAQQRLGRAGLDGTAIVPAAP